MNILYITPSLQHPAIPGSHRHYHFLKELSRQHRIVLLTLARAEVPAHVSRDLLGIARQLFVFNSTDHQRHNPALRLLGKIPIIGHALSKEISLRASIGKMKARFRELTGREHFDVIVLHGKATYKVVARCRDIPIVSDMCDATSMRVKAQIRHSRGWKLPMRLLRLAQTRMLEKAIVRTSRKVAFISPRDQEAIISTGSHWQIIPNGVDLDYWQRRTGLPADNVIIFTGVMSYAPNEAAALLLIGKVLPIIRKAVADARVLIVGSSPSAALKKAGDAVPGVTVTGYVEDLRPYLEQAAVFAAPLHIASGQQNKVLEAMAMALPVVTTPVVADGLRLTRASTVPVAIAEDPEACAGHIIRLLQNAGERRDLAAAGRRFVEQTFSWRSSGRKFEDLCFAAAEGL
ncbi:MAG: glycosyltransferase [Pseudomonadota bacterium]|nr:glycosyltransferase [Pseudomonadota bacterium]